MPMGTCVTGKMAAALRRLGFDKVFDTDFAADLTIMEEANELIDRVQERRRAADDHLLLARAGSSSASTTIPDFLPNLSTCKSPHEMFGAVIKSYYAEKQRHRPEGHRGRFGHALHGQEVRGRRATSWATNGLPDVDIVITTRELARMIKQAGIDFAQPAGRGFRRDARRFHRRGGHLRRRPAA